MDWSAARFCRSIATEIWSGQRTHVGFHVGGLNTEMSVRRRLRHAVGHLPVAVVPGGALHAARQIDWRQTDPLEALERTEAIVEKYCRPPQGRDAFDFDSKAERVLARLLVLQSLAGRLGHWGVREEELADGKIARRLLSKLKAKRASPDLVQKAENDFAEGAYLVAAERLLLADLAHRVPSALFRAAICLWKAEHYEPALWAIRACLLEDVQAFSTPQELLKAHMVESSLNAIVNVRLQKRGLGGLKVPDLELGARGNSTLDAIEWETFDRAPTERFKIPE